MELEALALAGGIFALRVVGNMITTVRLVMLMRGYRLVTMTLAALESLIFAVALGSVVQNLGNVLNLTAYCTGYAIGGYLGMELESRLVKRYVSVHVISPTLAHEIAQAVRAAGFGATESWGQGAEGQVGSVTIVVGHREVQQVANIVQAVDPQAFTMMEELRAISRGHFRRLMRPER